MHLQGMPVQNQMVLYRKINYKIRCRKGKLMLCLFISMSFCLYIQIITITSVSVNIFTQFKTDTYSSGFLKTPDYRAIDALLACY